MEWKEKVSEALKEAAAEYWKPCRPSLRPLYIGIGQELGNLARVIETGELPEGMALAAIEHRAGALAIFAASVPAEDGEDYRQYREGLAAGAVKAGVIISK